MQTFLPYEDFEETARCLDNKRLNKQIVEAMQIYTANVNFVCGIKSGWQNHPAVKMWRGFESLLLQYRNACVREWHSRGFESHRQTITNEEHQMEVPAWLGNKEFHRSHQSNLVRKLPEHYRKFFKDVPDNLSYIWPIK